MQSINNDNWTFCRYEKENFIAFITFGADPESMKDDRLEYYVTVLEDEEKEVFQEKFDSLNLACLSLNEKYGDWKFENQSVAKEGCSTCAAH